MDWWLITFSLGALLSLFLPIVPSSIYVIILIILAISTYFCKKTRKSCVFILGIAWLVFHGANYQEDKKIISGLSAQAKYEKLLVVGLVDSIPIKKERKIRFNFLLKRVNNVVLSSPIKVRLSWEQPNDNAAHIVSQGQQWQLYIKLKPAHGLANVGGFSYQTWLRRHNIGATGYVLSKEGLRAKFQPRLISPKPTLRQQLFIQTQALLPESSLSPLILALTFGERGLLTKEHWRVLKHTSTQHLIAISGLHIGLVAAGAFYIFNLIFKCLPLNFLSKNKLINSLLPQFFHWRLLNLTQYNAGYFIIGLSLSVAYFYSYLAGFSVPTLRALMMLLVFWGAKLVSIHLTSTRLLFVTVSLIVVFFPFSLLSMSFWLSFYAVSVIFILSWRYQLLFHTNNKSESFNWCKVKRWCVTLLSLQIGLSIFMLPLTIVMNNSVTLMSIPANIIAVPWMSITAIPLSLLALISSFISDSLSVFFLECALWSLNLLWRYLTWLSQYDLADVNVSFEQWLIFTVCFVMFVLFYIVKHPYRRFILAFSGMLMFIMLSIFHLQRLLFPTNNGWTVSVMDVGQGLSIIIEVTGRGVANVGHEKDDKKVLVYDTGASFRSDFSMAESVIYPYLIHQGYQAIDKLVISHQDNDHAGGLSFLLENFTVNELIYNQPVLLTQPIKRSMCKAGNQQQWEHLSIEMLWPHELKAEENDDSCVLRISDGKTSVLLTGDISRKVEEKLIALEGYKEVSFFSKEAEHSAVLKSTIMIAPHHGSKTSSSVKFIQAVSPKYSVFSAGFHNRWKMPMDDVVKRYHEQDVSTWSTAKSGMISFEILDENIHINTYRKNRWPFWFAN